MIISFDKPAEAPKGIDASAIPQPERVREAKDKVKKDTGHHSYSGRSEYIQGIMDKAIQDPIKVSGDPKAINYLIKNIHATVCQKWPWHASPKHIELTIRGYLARMVKRVTPKEEPAKGRKSRKLAKSTELALAK